MLEFRLPFGVGPKGMARVGLPLRLQRQHFPGVIKNGGSSVFLRSFPFRVGQ